MKYVQTLLEVYHKFGEVVKSAFENDSAFVASLDKVNCCYCYYYYYYWPLCHKSN